MSARLQEAEPATANQSPVPEHFSREDTMVAERAGGGHGREQHDVPDRKLRNRIIIANAVAWILIIILVRLIFF
jgi:hypothetical protein